MHAVQTRLPIPEPAQTCQVLAGGGCRTPRMQGKISMYRVPIICLSLFLTSWQSSLLAHSMKQVPFGRPPRSWKMISIGATPAKSTTSSLVTLNGRPRSRTAGKGFTHPACGVREVQVRAPRWPQRPYRLAPAQAHRRRQRSPGREAVPHAAIGRPGEERTARGHRHHLLRDTSLVFSVTWAIFFSRTLLVHAHLIGASLQADSWTHGWHVG
jgi:hypothetical protein